MNTHDDRPIERGHTDPMHFREHGRCRVPCYRCADEPAPEACD